MLTSTSKRKNPEEPSSVAPVATGPGGNYNPAVYYQPATAAQRRAQFERQCKLALADKLSETITLFLVPDANFECCSHEESGKKSRVPGIEDWEEWIYEKVPLIFDQDKPATEHPRIHDVLRPFIQGLEEPAPFAHVCLEENHELHGKAITCATILVAHAYAKILATRAGMQANTQAVFAHAESFRQLLMAPTGVDIFRVFCETNKISLLVMTDLDAGGPDSYYSLEAKNSNMKIE